MATSADIITPRARVDRGLLNETLAEYAKLDRRLREDIKRHKQLEDTAKDLVRELGSDYDHDDVLCTLGKPQQRTKWNTRELDGYAIANPDVLQFRSSYTTKASVRLTVKGKKA